jgi:hypothetical protein
VSTDPRELPASPVSRPRGTKVDATRELPRVPTRAAPPGSRRLDGPGAHLRMPLGDQVLDLLRNRPAAPPRTVPPPGRGQFDRAPRQLGQRREQANSGYRDHSGRQADLRSRGGLRAGLPQTPRASMVHPTPPTPISGCRSATRCSISRNPSEGDVDQQHHLAVPERYAQVRQVRMGQFDGEALSGDEGDEHDGHGRDHAGGGPGEQGGRQAQGRQSENAEIGVPKQAPQPPGLIVLLALSGARQTGKVRAGFGHGVDVLRPNAGALQVGDRTSGLGAGGKGEIESANHDDLRSPRRRLAAARLRGVCPKGARPRRRTGVRLSVSQTLDPCRRDSSALGSR